jgi:hypothetical protein
MAGVPSAFCFYLLKLAAVPTRQSTEHRDFLRLLFAIEIIDDMKMGFPCQTLLTGLCDPVYILGRDRFEATVRL